jgi:hypothetical protein
LPASRRRALLAALSLSLLAAAPAQAADTISISFGNDPTEEVPVAVTVNWTSDVSSNRIFVTYKPAGPLGCAANYSADDPNSTDLITESGEASGSSSENVTFEDPGDYTFCGYLQNNAGETTPRKATGPVTLTVRGARATVGLTVPERVDAGQRFALGVPVTTELSRRVFVTIKPAGGRGCEPNYSADDPASTDVLNQSAQGTQMLDINYTASETEGTYLLCAYVLESSSETVPEATASAQFRVGPDPCVVARNALALAQQRLGRAQTKVARERKAVRRAKAASRRGSRRARRRARARARRAGVRLRSALRTRATAQGVVTAAQGAVTQACGTPPR